MKQKTIKQILESKELNVEVIVKAWLRTRRDSKDFSFLELNDGSCLACLQVIAASSLSNYSDTVLNLHTGAAVEVQGILVQSKGKEQSIEVQAAIITLIGSCDPETYPLQKKRHSFEFLRYISHLRPRTNTLGAVFRVRSCASYAIHKFFNEHGFVYLHTPIITTSDCEGAGKVFQVTTLELEELSKNKNVSPDYSKDFFGEKAILTVSGQLEAECYALALNKVYTFGPTFRAENSNTPRHLAEFWMIEPEMAFCDLKQNTEVAEGFLKYIISYVLENCKEDMQFFDKWIEKGIISQLQKVVEANFERITYTEAVSILEKSGKTFQYPCHWGLDLQTEHERYLTDEYIKKPVFVTNYPKEIKTFYMRLDEDEKTVSAMDLLTPRLGEIIGGSQREEREDKLRMRMKECGLDENRYSWYLDLRRFGSVKHSGFGLGFERLLMYITGMSNIRDVIAFPRTPGNA